jgi:hypothetical protein
VRACLANWRNAGGDVEFTWLVDDRARPGVNLTSMTGLRNSLIISRTPVTTLGTLDFWMDRWASAQCRGWGGRLQRMGPRASSLLWLPAP